MGRRPWEGPVGVALATLALLSVGACDPGAVNVDVKAPGTTPPGAIPGDDTAWDYPRCALDLALVNASHTVRLDAATGAVTAIDAVREDDPRAALFATNPVGPGTPVTLTRTDQVDGFADAGARPLALVGQQRSDLPDEWTVFALADDRDEGVRFAGPCAPEYDRQFAALRTAFGGSSDIELLRRMFAEALLPGRGADLRNVVMPAGSTVAMVTDPVAPRWEGRVRVVWFTVAFSPQGVGGAAGLQSDAGTFGVGVGQGLSATTVDMMGVIPLEGTVRVVIFDDLGREVATPLDLDDTNCRDAPGMLLNVDLAASTAACHAGISPAQQEQVDAALAALVFDHTAAVPEFADGPPAQM